MGRSAQTQPGDGAERVLWVGGRAPAGPCAANPRVAWEPDRAEAIARAATEAFDAVVVDDPDPDIVAEVLQAAARNKGKPQRLATSTYEAIPELVRRLKPGLIERLLAKPACPDHRLGLDAAQVDASVAGIASSGSRALATVGEASIEGCLSNLVKRIMTLPSVVIRPLSGERVPRLELVVPTSAAWQDLRIVLPELLGPPLKAAGCAMERRYREHPLRRLLGSLSHEQEVYTLGEGAYVALFPWRDAAKVTVVIGFEPADEIEVAMLHAHAVASATEFPLPSRHQHSPHLFYDPDYDWVITRSYVGPDRRRTSTSFINRYTFRGRRKALMPNELCSAGTFVDIAPAWAWAAAAVLATLFLIDTAMTAYYVGGGRVAELNPLMRWALQRSPVLFWGLKSALALLVAFIVIRWHLWRPGRWLFATSVIMYAAIDVYWLVLWWTRWA